MKITIDQYSGFCFGVVYAIEMAESILKEEGHLYCLGDIVHNNKEVDRLNELGLEIINHNDLHNLNNCKVLIRAHGEPPSTYELALKNNIQLLDASCPVVLKLQNQIKGGYEEIKKIDGQVIIYGKEGHAEVVGLLGQTNNNAIIVATVEDLDKIDFTKPIYIYSQTTKSPEAYKSITQEIESRIKMNIRVVDQEMTDESVTVSLFTQSLDGDRWIDQGINAEQSLKVKQSILTSARSLAIASEL